MKVIIIQSYVYQVKTSKKIKFIFFNLISFHDAVNWYFVDPYDLVNRPFHMFALENFRNSFQT